MVYLLSLLAGLFVYWLGRWSVGRGLRTPEGDTLVWMKDVGTADKLTVYATPDVERRYGVFGSPTSTLADVLAVLPQVGHQFRMEVTRVDTVQHSDTYWTATARYDVRLPDVGPNSVHDPDSPS